jgi:hypothetical protein
VSTRWAQKLSLDKLAQIGDRLSLTELHGPDGGPFRSLVSPRSGQDCGETRILVGDGVVKKVVYHAVVAEMIGLDSHMIFAFTDPESAIPHWTFDSVVAGGVYAFHLDLLPRADLGAHLKYMDAAYGPLTDSHASGREIPGLTEPDLSPRQRSVMSQWMLAYRVPEDEYKNIDPFVQAYLDHWFTLVEKGLPEDVVASVGDTELAVRDQRNRGMIFNRDVDPVWDMITPLVGQEQSELMRLNLATNELIEDVPVPSTL